ncbi:PDZ domain-containing protein [Flexithrix dorotheae]|uniref:PDZ domain-containing protein n=1 Tax=Flexithrix dorotheae TaxID=70993 RepID=UPI00036AC053|nr:PDZ domain-containing protein [Flexithrix dorotheae]
MTSRLYILLLLGSLIWQCCNQPAVEIFVAENGKEDPEGTKDAPFLKIEDAILKARQIKQGNNKAKVVINILPGEYHLSAPIGIDPSLNGLEIKGAGNSRVIVKGSVPLSLSWKKFDQHIYEASLSKDIDFDQFIVNNKPQILARYPNYDENGGYWQGHAKDAISRERVKSWANPAGAIFHAMHRGKWGGFHYVITSIDSLGNPVLEGGFQNNRPSPPHEEYRMVENVFEELDSPGEWYLDKTTQKIYYWPANGIDLLTAKYEGAVLKSLIEIKGEEKSPVQNIAIKGIRFEFSQRTFLESYEPLLRSDWTIYRGGAVLIENAENCSVSACEFTNLGGNAVFISGYNRNITIAENHIHDCGASAICFIGHPSAVRSPAFQYGEFVPLEEMDTVSGPKNEFYPKDCVAEDNLIYRIGRIEKQTAGVQIAMAMDITVCHNSIYDVPRAGINIGDGTWGGHILEFNDVFNTVLETGDHGSFNSWGRDRFWLPKRNKMDSLTQANPDMPKWDAIHTTIIRNNRFRCDHGWDIDLDDGSSNYHIYNNLCLNGGIKLREGFNRVVENNITVNNTLHPHVWFANCEDVFLRNIVRDSYKDVNVLSWGKEIDYNLFPDKESLMKAQIYNIDANSSFGDPQFSNPDQLNFSVKATSPALALGFKNFPMDEFGVVSPQLKKLAKTPEIPELKNMDEIKGNSSPVVSWLRNEIKSVDSKEEQSAYGLNTPEGVVVLKMWKGSYAAQGDGLKSRDVVLKVEGHKIKNITDFFWTLKKYNQSPAVNMLVMRNQSEEQLIVKVKK